jgi:hypothetical protein
MRTGCPRKSRTWLHLVVQEDLAGGSEDDVNEDAALHGFEQPGLLGLLGVEPRFGQGVQGCFGVVRMDQDVDVVGVLGSAQDH